jgi:hypothetical protein
MITLLFHLLRLLPFLVGGHRQVALENPALRQQLVVYKRTLPRPKLRTIDRLFWVGLARAWTSWRQSLVIVTPDTVLRWHRRRFREHWTQLSRRASGGRPPLNAKIAALVRKMATANPLWGAPRIHGELLKLGIHIAEPTVSRLMPKNRPQPLIPGGRSSPTKSPTWSRSTSLPCPPLASVSSSSLSCSLTTAGGSSISTSPHTPPLYGQLCLPGAPAGGAVPSSALGLTSMGTGPNSG